MKRLLKATILLFGLALIGLTQTATAKTTFVTIGSGSTSGLYYPTAVGMAKIINDAHIDLRASARSTGASVYNCRAIGNGQLQMGISQNNVAYYAFNGKGVKAFDGKPEKELRGMVMLYPEVIQILARKDAHINSIADFKGKRVYVGDIGSGTEQDAMHVLSAYDLDFADLKAAVRGSSGSAVNLLRDGKIDAMFYTVGIGASAITEAAQTAPIKLVQIPAEKVKSLSQDYPFYTAITIPAGTYPNIDSSTPTITLQAMLLVSSKMSTHDVYDFLNTIFGKNIKKFYNDIQNPNLKKYFTLKTALDGMPVPLHPGAVKFFKEQGISVPTKLIPHSS